MSYLEPEDQQIYDSLIASNDPLAQAYALQLQETGYLPFSYSAEDDDFNAKVRFAQLTGADMYETGLASHRSIRRGDRGRINMQNQAARSAYQDRISQAGERYGEGFSELPWWLQQSLAYNATNEGVDSRVAAINEAVANGRHPSELITINDPDGAAQFVPVEQLGNFNASGGELQWNQMPLHTTRSGDNNALSDSHSQIYNNALSNQNLPQGDNSLTSEGFMGRNNLGFTNVRGQILDSNMWTRDDNNTLVRNIGEQQFGSDSMSRGKPMPVGSISVGGAPSGMRPPNWMGRRGQPTDMQPLPPVYEAMNTNPSIVSTGGQAEISPLSQDMDYITYQHPAQYLYPTAESVQEFLGPDYRARMMDNIINRDMHVGQQIGQYSDMVSNTLPGMFDSSYIQNRRGEMDQIAAEGNLDASNRMSAGTDMASANYLNTLQGAGNMRNLSTGAANLQLEGGAQDFDTGVTGAGGEFAGNIGDIAGQYGSDVVGVGDEFGENVARSGRNFDYGVGNETYNAISNQRDLYSPYIDQGENATALLDRMSGGDYSSELLNRRLNQTYDDLEARYNAAGLSNRTGAVVEAMADARADLVAEQVNRDWERDAQLAQMTGQLGVTGAGAMYDAYNTQADRRIMGDQAVMDTIREAEQARMGMGASAAEAAMQAGMTGEQAMMDTSLAGEQAMLDASRQGAANAYQTGMMNAQDMMAGGRDIYGAYLSNVGRDFQADQALTGQMASNADAYYGDMYRNAQNMGGTALNQNAQILQNQLNRGRDYYGSMMQFDAETTRANAQARLEDQARRANIETNNATRMSDIYGNQANTYNQMASGFYDLGGSMVMGGLTSGMNAYSGKGGQGSGENPFAGTQGSGMNNNNQFWNWG